MLHYIYPRCMFYFSMYMISRRNIIKIEIIYMQIFLVSCHGNNNMNNNYQYHWNFFDVLLLTTRLYK